MFAVNASNKHMNKARAPLRFDVGESVRVNDSISSRFVGAVGQVVEARRNYYSHTLDKYVVRLLSGEKAVFWDIQLVKSADALVQRNAEIDRTEF